MKNKKAKENEYIRTNLTDTEKQTLLKIEARGCWLVFWGLLLALILQMCFNNHSWRSLIGESLVFLALDAYIIISCIKKGIWDKNLKPNLKTNAIMSFIISVVIGLVFFFVGLKYSMETYTALTNALTIFSISFVCFVAGFTIYAFVHRKKVRDAMESENESTDIMPAEPADFNLNTENSTETDQTFENDSKD